MEPSCHSGPGSRQKTLAGQRDDIERKASVGPGIWDLTYAVTEMPLMVRFPDGSPLLALMQKPAPSQVALFHWVDFSLKVALDPLKRHKTFTPDTWPWE